MRLREATPRTHVRAPGFVTRSRGCGLEDIRMPLYDVSPEAHALSALRKEIGLGLRDAASKLGIRAIELSELERGRLVPENWSKILETLKP